MFEIIFNDLFKYLLPFILLSVLVGIVSYPLSYQLFKKNFDKGLINAVIIGYIFIGWLSFTFSTIISFFNVKFSFTLLIPSLISSILIWGIINLVIYKRYKKSEIKTEYFKISTAFFTFSILILFTLFLYFINSFDYTYNPTGSENHMNLAILNSIFYSNSIPINDFWYSGYPLNYYYFSHYVIASISYVLNFTPNNDLTFLGIIFPALFLTSITILVLSIIKNNIKIVSKAQIISSILITCIITLLINPIKSIFGLYEYLLGYKSIDYFVENFSDYTVRIIPFAITENFNYPILINALHALTSGLVVGVLIVNSLYYYINFSEKISLKNKYLLFIFTLIGFAGLINTWDILVYVGLTLLTIGFYKRDEFLKNPLSYSKSLVLCLYPTIIIMIPWFVFFESPGGTPNIVHKVSNLIDLFSFWGIYLILYMLVLLKHKKIFDTHNFILFLTSTGVLLIIFLEIFYFKDALAGGNYFRANTYYKISNLVLLFFSIGFSSFLLLYFFKLKSEFFLKFFIIFLITLTLWFNFPLMKFKSKNFVFTGIVTQEKLIQGYSPELLELIKFFDKNKTPNLVILEGAIEGGYKYTNFVSVFTGVPTVLGWGNHEMTWRNTRSFTQVTIEKLNDINEIYTGEDLSISKNLIKKYSVDYVLVSKSEKEIYQDKLKEEKIQKLGEVVFEKGETKLIKIIE